MPERFNPQFWTLLDELVKQSSVVIDRPHNTAHPEWDNLIYPLDYGYLAGTTSSDGAGIDVWIGASGEKQVRGVICTVDLVKRDSEIKVLLGCTEDEMHTVTSFHSQGGSMGCFLIRRED